MHISIYNKVSRAGRLFDDPYIRSPSIYIYIYIYIPICVCIYIYRYIFLFLYHPRGPTQCGGYFSPCSRMRRGGGRMSLSGRRLDSSPGITEGRDGGKILHQSMHPSIFASIRTPSIFPRGYSVKGRGKNPNEPPHYEYIYIYIYIYNPFDFSPGATV